MYSCCTHHLLNPIIKPLAIIVFILYLTYLKLHDINTWCICATLVIPADFLVNSHDMKLQSSKNGSTAQVGKLKLTCLPQNMRHLKLLHVATGPTQSTMAWIFRTLCSVSM